MIVNIVAFSSVVSADNHKGPMFKLAKNKEMVFKVSMFSSNWCHPSTMGGFETNGPECYAFFNQDDC